MCDVRLGLGPLGELSLHRGLGEKLRFGEGSESWSTFERVLRCCRSYSLIWGVHVTFLCWLVAFSYVVSEKMRWVRCNNEPRQYFYLSHFAFTKDTVLQYTGYDVNTKIHKSCWNAQNTPGHPWCPWIKDGPDPFLDYPWFGHKIVARPTNPTTNISLGRIHHRPIHHRPIQAQACYNQIQSTSRSMVHSECIFRCEPWFYFVRT